MILFIGFDDVDVDRLVVESGVVDYFVKRHFEFIMLEWVVWYVIV